MYSIYLQHIQRGELLGERQRFKEAEEEYRKAISILPDGGVPHAMLANSILRQKDKSRYAEAYREAEMGVAHAPENAYTYYVLARVLCALDRLKDAEKFLRKSVELAPEDPDYRVLLAALLMDTNRTAEARLELNRCLAIDPDHQSTLSISVLWESTHGKPNKASEFAKQLLHVAPDQAESYVAWGTTMIQSNLYLEAEEAFREALRLDPNNQEAQAGLKRSLDGKKIPSEQSVFLIWLFILLVPLLGASVFYLTIPTESKQVLPPSKELKQAFPPDPKSKMSEEQRKATAEFFIREIKKRAEQKAAQEAEEATKKQQQDETN